MSEFPKCHVKLDGPASGIWNMALDEALLNAAVEDSFCALRFYEWQEPTVTLGHFQQADDPLLDDRFPALARVRRLSGGGAILHDRELTYSCVVPASHQLARNPGTNYDVVHAGIVEILTDLGIPCAMRGSPLTEPEPFLCFGRGDARDIVVHGHKIVGSAQRRRRGAILQHGAILLGASPHAPEFPGIMELANQRLEPRKLANQLAPRIGWVLGESHLLTDWPAQILESARALVPQYELPTAPN